MILAALLFAQLCLLGTGAVAPWRLAGGTDSARRLAALVALPLALLALLLALFHLALAPDAAIAWGIVWPPRTIAARLLGVTVLAGAAVAVLVAIGGSRFEPAAWRTAGVLSGLVAAGSAFGGELLRLGGGPYAGTAALLVAVAARLAVTLAAGESATGLPRYLAPVAGLLLPVAHLAAPAALRVSLGLVLPTLGASALLLLAAPFVPLRFRRSAALAGVALAALYFAEAAAVSATFESRQFSPESAIAPAP
jgi:hypothetical protein